MNSSTEKHPIASVSDGKVSVCLPNGVTFSFPIAGNWRLESASFDQLNNIEVDEDGIHWPEIDEDLSFEGLLKGDWGQYIRRPLMRG